MNRAQRRRDKARNRGGPRILYKAPDLDPAQAEAVLRNSAAMDAIADSDRDWFATHPGRTYRLRPFSEPEAVQVAAPDVPDICNYIIVRQIRPGVRMRLGIKAYRFHDPENFSDAACAHLFAEAKAREGR